MEGGGVEGRRATRRGRSLREGVETQGRGEILGEGKTVGGRTHIQGPCIRKELNLSQKPRGLWFSGDGGTRTRGLGGSGWKDGGSAWESPWD